MDSGGAAGLLVSNQDLFRASLSMIDRSSLVRALLWLDGEAPYPPPISIHLDLTLRCNGHCLHCKQWTWPRHRELSIEQLRRIFDTFSRWGVQTVTLGGGNPLLHGHTVQALHALREAGIQVGLITEGAKLSSEQQAAICECARWIRFSIDGPNAALHDKIRNSPGLFDQAIHNIQQLRNQPNAPSIGINCVIQKTNLGSLSEMVDLAEHLKVNFLLFKLPHGDDPDRGVMLSPEEYRRVVAWVRANCRSRATEVQTNLPELSDLLESVFCEADVTTGRPVHCFYLHSQAHCFAPLFFLVCDSEGNVYPCDYLQADTRTWGHSYGTMRKAFRVGNLLEDSEQVLANLELLVKTRVHDLPTSGYSECGCCTRFCQLNAMLSMMEREIQSENLTEQELNLRLQKLGVGTALGSFL